MNDASSLITIPSKAAERFCDIIIDDISKQAVSVRKFYHIGPLTVEHCIYGRDLSMFLTPALGHLEAGAIESANFRVYSIDESDCISDLPKPFWSWTQLDNQGYILGLDEKRFTIHYDAMSMAFRLLDRERKIAIHWVRNFNLVPYWERSFPLRPLINWIVRDTALQPVHAAAVGVNGSAVLLGAKGGSGKSTTALNCLFSGMQYLGDDFILFDIETKMVYSLYNVVKLTPGDIARYPQFAPFINPAESDQDKTQIFLHEHYPDQLVRSAQIKYVLIPRIEQDSTQTTISVINPEESFGALATSTFYLLKGNNARAHEKIHRLVKEIPCRYLNLGSDRSGPPEKIRQLLESSHYA